MNEEEFTKIYESKFNNIKELSDFYQASIEHAIHLADWGDVNKKPPLTVPFIPLIIDLSYRLEKMESQYTTAMGLIADILELQESKNNGTSH